MIYGSGTEQIKPYRKKCIIKFEKRKAPVYRRQAEDEPAGRLFFNLLDGLPSDLEPMAPGAGQ
jgi:hypothetical protein